jgi:hypothetical protein
MLRQKQTFRSGKIEAKQTSASYQSEVCSTPESAHCITAQYAHPP